MSQPTELGLLADTFRLFAARDFHGSSPLYERLALDAANDAAMLAIAAHTPTGQPSPLLFFGAIHYLLLGGVADLLAAFYPSLTANPEPPDAAYPYFRAFCLAQRDAIIMLLQTRRVQTNEVGRCALLLPVFSLIDQRRGYQPLTLVDVGCSAGLNLLWDKYAYDYGDTHIYGDSASPVRLSCELRGSVRPPLPAKLPTVSRRFGIDLNPIDVRDRDAELWLQALIWPEHSDRATNMRDAIAVLRDYPPPLIAGDVLDLLPKVIASAPTDSVLCIYHTYSLYQLPHPARVQLSGIIEAAAQQRDLYWFGAEGDSEGHSLTLTCYERGRVSEMTLAHNHPHGRWLEWLI